MCGRYAMNDEMNTLLEQIVEAHGIRVLADWRSYLPNYNVKPTNQVPIIMHSAREDSRVIATARWSLVPRWSKTLKLAYPTFNARSEELASKRTWQGPLKRSRCLIPASGYYEWVGEKAPKTPHYIHPAEGLLMFAGLYSWWADPALPEDDEDRWHLTATILTMDTVPELAHIHDRNPVALPEELWWDWIDPDLEGDQAMVDGFVAAAAPVMAGLEEYVTGPVRGQAPTAV